MILVEKLRSDLILLKVIFQRYSIRCLTFILKGCPFPNTGYPECVFAHVGGWVGSDNLTE